MRSNLPVTGREHPIDGKKVLISKTDAEGIITYVNDDFVEVHGFSEEELIGQPHNIVRHPDMPPVAFEDMWRTLKEGKAWTGVVKNRCKNGDHYWSEATVRQNLGGGYTSMRIRPTQADIDRAEKIYKAMREGKSPYIVHYGSFIRPTLFWRITNRLRALNTNVRLWSAIVFSTLLIVLPDVLTWLGIIPDSASTNLLSAGFGVLVMLAIGAWLSHDLISPMQEITERAKRIASGDLTQSVISNSDNETGRILEALGTIRNNFHETLYYMRSSVQHLQDSTQILTTNADKAASAAVTQAESAAEVSASMEEMTVSIDQVGEHAKEAKDISRKSGQQSEEGGQIIHQAADSMHSIASLVNDSSEVIRELEASANSISTVVTVIKDIADQTNLLALNAAIEAARAGEQGRGFAVVADEVRKLAERTANSTEEIATMVENIQNGASQAVASMETGVSRVSEGEQLAHQAGDSITAIRESANHVVVAVDDISAALNEQSSAAQNIAQNIERIAHISDENSMSASQTVESARTIEQISTELGKTVDQFKV